MIVMSAVTALVLLALVTQAGIVAVQRAFPPQGRMIEVEGAVLHVVDIGPRDAGLPIVMLHGASSNLEVMRHPLGELLAKQHRVILIDRPGHGWSTRARRQDSTPDIQARMIDAALGKLGVDRAVFVVHSWSGALGARLALDHRKPRCRPRDAGAGDPSLARRRRPLQRDHRDAGDRPAARLYRHVAAGLFRRRVRRAQRLPAADDAGRFREGVRDAAAAAPARIHRQCL